MYKSCSYTKQEILKVIAEHASQTLTSENPGVIRAQENEDGSVEVFFIEHEQDNSQQADN